MKLGSIVSYRYLDGQLPEIIPINNVMDDLSNGPTASGRPGIQVGILQSYHGAFEQ